MKNEGHSRETPAYVTIPPLDNYELTILKHLPELRQSFSIGLRQTEGYPDIRVFLFLCVLIE